jgi:hypothetical protein
VAAGGSDTLSSSVDAAGEKGTTTSANRDLPSGSVNRRIICTAGWSIAGGSSDRPRTASVALPNHGDPALALGYARLTPSAIRSAAAILATLRATTDVR